MGEMRKASGRYLHLALKRLDKMEERGTQAEEVESYLHNQSRMM